MARRDAILHDSITPILLRSAHVFGTLAQSFMGPSTIAQIPDRPAAGFGEVRWVGGYAVNDPPTSGFFDLGRRRRYLWTISSTAGASIHATPGRLRPGRR